MRTPTGHPAFLPVIGLAPTAGLLIGARVLQGLGGLSGMLSTLAPLLTVIGIATGGG